MAAALVLRPSRRLLKAALHREVDRAFDADETACFETVKANEHVEFYEYATRRTPFRKRLKTSIFAYEDQPERRRIRRPA